MDTAFAHMEKVLAEYKRGLITGVEFLSELAIHTKMVEEVRAGDLIKLMLEA